MKLDGYLIGTDIENENLVLRLYVGDYDVNYDHVEKSCAIISIHPINDSLNEFKKKLDNLTKDTPHILINSNEDELIISLTYTDDIQIHIPIIKEPKVLFIPDYKVIKWKIDMIFEELNSKSKNYNKLIDKLNEINSFLKNEYSNSKKKIEYFIANSNIEKLNELEGKMKLIEKLLSIIPKQ